MSFDPTTQNPLIAPAPVALPGSVLLIDDNEDDREHFVHMLRAWRNPPQVRCAATGREGLAMQQERPATCVLLDYSLPGDDGLQVLDWLRQSDPFLPVVMITGQGNEALAVAALRAGASDYVVKGEITAAGLERCIGFAAEGARLRRRIAEKTDDIEHFMRTLIHDARAPLRHITRFAEFLAEDVADRNFDSAGEYTRAIIRSARRLDDLLMALRSYVLANGELTLAPVAMDGVIRAALEMTTDQIALRDAKVTCAPLPLVVGHEPQLVQLFQNLVSNAIKYATDVRPEIRITASGQPGERVQIEVADNGPGIPTDQLELIFTPFTRLVSKDRIEGTGLGLAICRRISEKLGGSIHCRSEPGRGSRFVVELAAAG